MARAAMPSSSTRKRKSSLNAGPTSGRASSKHSEGAVKQLGIGVVGLGRMGQCHAGNLRGRIPEAKLLAVTDSDLPTAQRVAAELEVPAAYTSLDAVLERRDIDAVVIA